MRAAPILALLAASLAAGPGWASEPEVRTAAAEIAEVRFVDGVPFGPTVAERLGVIRRRIQAALEYPPLARLQQIEGSSLVRFEIGRDGTPHDVQVHRTSGTPSLDRAALRAVAAAAPLPWVYGRLEVPIRFDLTERR
jgi:protein TonB